MSNINADPRWGKVIAWIAGVGGSLTVVLLIWIGSTLVDVKIGMAEQRKDNQSLQTGIASVATKVDRIEDRQNSMDSRLTSMEARQVRALR